MPAPVSQRPLRGRPDARLVRGGSALGVLVLLALVAGLALGGRALWRKVRLDGYHVKPSAIEAPADTVVLYTASWCGRSKRAKAFLDEEGIAYEERDIDLTPGAREDLAALESGGVPVIVVGDRKIVGWNRDAYAYLLDHEGFR
jgi:glutaredoxin